MLPLLLQSFITITKKKIHSTIEVQLHFKGVIPSMIFTSL